MFSPERRPGSRLTAEPRLQLRSISFCTFLASGQSPSCTALKILPRSRLLSAALSAHGSAAVFVDEAATLGVAEPQGRLLLGLEPAREARLA